MSAAQGLDRGLDGVLIYRFSPDNPPTEKQAKFIREGLKIGEGPKVYPVYPVEDRAATETAYVYGCTGVESAGRGGSGTGPE